MYWYIYILTEQINTLNIFNYKRVISYDYIYYLYWFWPNSASMASSLACMYYSFSDSYVWPIIIIVILIGR